AIAPNAIAPGVGLINNNFPGNLINGTMTQVLSPSMVNETIVGFSFNHWGHRVGKGKENAANYTQWWQPNVVNPLTNEVGLFPPRLEPFGDYGEPIQKNDNKDEWPYLPRMAYSGGDRGGLFTMTPSGSSGPLPKWNRNIRTTLRNDLSWTRGRHNFKFGGELEQNSKTEPGSADRSEERRVG